MPSSIVKKPSAQEKILNPDKFTTEINGEKFKLKPFSDVVFQELGQIIGEVVSVLGIVNIVFGDGLENANLNALGSQIPGLFNIIIPSSTKILAHSLKPVNGDFTVDEAWIEDNIYAKDRIRLLSEALEANGLSEILGELTKAAEKLIPKKEPLPALMPMPLSPENTPSTNPIPSDTN